MSQEIKVTFIDDNEWKVPFNFALFLHITVILGAIYGPGFLNKKPLLPDIYTVDLISVQEPAVQPAQPTQAQQPPVKAKQPATEIKSTPPKKAAPIIEKEKIADIQAPIKPVSIKPLKRKKIKKTPQVDNQKKILERRYRKNIEQAREAERRANEAARIAASEAVNQLKDMLRTSTISGNTAPSKPTASSNRASRGNAKNVVENQYFALIHSRLQPHWKTPEYREWSKDLEATIVIRITKDGTITDQFFERRSGDRLFDQFVLKALQDGSPLPPIPAALRKNNVEIGLRFVPGSIN